MYCFILYIIYLYLYIYNINFIYITYTILKNTEVISDYLLRATLFLLEKARAIFFITAIRDMIRKNNMFCFVSDC